jgi:integrase
MAKSTKSRRATKSPKPYAGFPLTAHRGTGRWCKKHKGTTHYFGKLDDWQAALAKYEREWPFIISGRAVPPEDAGEYCSVAILADEFLNAKRAKLDAGELSLGSFGDYIATCKRLVDHFGVNHRVDDMRPANFEPFRAKLAERYGVVMLRNEINRCRMVFKFAFDNRLIDRPVSYGQAFNRPSAKTLRIARSDAGPRMFEANEIRTILDAIDGMPIKVEGKKKPVKLKAGPALRAMVLLACNSGFGNNDVARLPLSAVNLESGWINFARPKTGIHRKIPLWSETGDALRKAIDARPNAAHPEDAVVRVRVELRKRRGSVSLRSGEAGNRPNRAPRPRG